MSDENTVGRIPAGDYEFEVLVSELRDRGEEQVLYVEIACVDAALNSSTVTWRRQLGSKWNEPEQRQALLDSLGVEGEYEAYELIGLRGVVRMEPGKPSTSKNPKWTGRRFLEPTDKPDAPEGFYPKLSQDRSDEFYTPVEENEDE